MIEFIMIAPVLLVIGAATLDISRYIRYHQITNFVSQEAANLAFKRCSDITVLNRPDANSTRISINAAATETAIQNCLAEIEINSQRILDNALGGTAITTQVFRWNTAGTVATSAAVCASPPPNPPLGQVKPDDSKRPKRPDLSKEYQDSKIVFPQSDTDKATGIKINRRGTLGLLISTPELCRRGRIVTVEVAYKFTPIVSFLPKFLTLDLGTDGEHRATTIL